MSERIVAIVPIRSLRTGKTRLTPVLEPEAREALLRRAAGRVVAAARESDVIETILIVSPDSETLGWAAGFDSRVIAHAQPETLPGLNGAIDAGRNWALEMGAAAVLSLFADLPLLVPDDIHGIVARAEPVVLGADRRVEGTNALLLRLDDPGPRFRFAFGGGSLGKHLAEAHRLGLATAVHHSPGIGFDLDTPGDWSDYLTLTASRTTECETNLAACGAGAG